MSNTLYQNLGANGVAQKVFQVGSSLDLRGLAANKPAYDAVEVGTTYWAVDTNVLEVSTGSEWKVV